MKRHTTYSAWLRESDEAQPYRESFAAFDLIPTSLPEVRRQVHDVIHRASKYAWVEYRDKTKNLVSKAKEGLKE